MFRTFILIFLNFFFILETKNDFNFQKVIDTDFNPNKYHIENNNLRNLNSVNFGRKNLIIGLIKGYNWSIIRTFFISLISAKYQNYDLVIYVDKLSEETLNKIKLCGAIVIDIPQKNLNYHELVKYKWKLFSDYLKENRDKYNLVFTTDVRDVIFQKDIFKYYENNNKPFISFTLEDVTLRNQVNEHWVKQFCKNDKEYERIADEQAINGGIIISNTDLFIEFCDALLETLSKSSKIFEQGAINYLIYYKKLFSDSVIITDNNGPIMTIFINKKNITHLNSENYLLNYKGEIAAIIHQYDRKPEIIRIIKFKYSDDILQKYFSPDKIKEANNVNSDYQNKIKDKNRINKIRKIILFTFIIVSIFILTLLKAKKSGIFESSEKVDTFKKLKIRVYKIKKQKNKKSINYNLTTSERKII